MKPVGVPKFVQKLYPKRIWEIPTNQKEVFLTFDDGPIPEVTPWVLETLSKYDAKATFFCIGDNVEKNPNVFNQILKEGHTVGNHTQNHLKGWKTATDLFIQNVERCQLTMNQNTDEENVFSHPYLFRPPYGKMTPRQAKALHDLNFKIIMWSILSYDYDAETTEEQCLNNVLKNIRPGSIIVFHDSLKAERNLRYTLPKILNRLNKEEYTFKSLSFT